MGGRVSLLSPAFKDGIHQSPLLLSFNYTLMPKAAAKKNTKPVSASSKQSKRAKKQKTFGEDMIIEEVKKTSPSSIITQVPPPEQPAPAPKPAETPVVPQQPQTTPPQYGHPQPQQAVPATPLPPGTWHKLQLNC